jgi:hypothetical protein
MKYLIPFTICALLVSYFAASAAKNAQSTSQPTHQRTASQNDLRQSDYLRQTVANFAKKYKAGTSKEI